MLSSKGVSVEDTVCVDLYKMEMERIKFLVKAYLRTRLAKIESQLLYLINKLSKEKGSCGIEFN